MVNSIILDSTVTNKEEKEWTIKMRREKRKEKMQIKKRIEKQNRDQKEFFPKALTFLKVSACK